MSTSNAIPAPTNLLCRDCKQFLLRCITENGLEGSKYFERRSWTSDWLSHGADADTACSICSALFLTYTANVGSPPTLIEGVNVAIWNGTTDKCNFVLSVRAMTPGDTMTIRHMNLDFQLGRIPESIAASISRTEPISSNTGSTQTFSKIQAWMEICKQHSFCSRWPSINGVARSLPTRLIEITNSVGCPQLRLVETLDLGPGCEYATLSHCWGGTLTFKLTLKSLQAFQSALPYNELPRTFRDAVKAALSLGFKYLWIDALCIIQDSSLDWSSEATEMAAVYGNAALNISAEHATDSNSGLFTDRAVEKIPVVVLEPKDGLEDATWICHATRFVEDVFDSRVNSRAWVVQERFLAPRVVHFASNQIFWECECLLAAESLPATYDLQVPDLQIMKRFTPNIRHLLDSACGGLEVFEIWNKLVFIYAKGGLTVSSDRSVAISGIARIFCHHLGFQPSDYICGMWRSTFVEELMWYVFEHGGSGQRSSGTSVPSWSWMSVTGSIDRGRSMAAHPSAELLEIRSRTERDDPFGVVLGGYAQLRGCLCQARLSPASGSCTFDYRERLDRELILGSNVLREMQSFALRLDDISEAGLKLAFDQELYLLLCQTSQDRESSWTADGDPSMTNTPENDGKATSRSRMVLREEDLDYVVRFECLVLLPTDKNATFKRAGVIYFKERLHDPDPEDHDQWLRARAALYRQLHAPDVPTHHYEDVDKNMMYTVTLV